VVILIATSTLVVNASHNADHTQFEYDTAPADSTAVALGSEYVHEYTVTTNATNGPLVLTVYYNQGADLEYNSHNVVVDGTPVNMDVVVENITVNGNNLTRVQLTNGTMPGSGERSFDVNVSFSTSNDVTEEVVYTGGTHGTTGLTLPLQETELAITGSDVTPTSLEVSDSSPEVGDNITVSVGVANFGGLDAGSVPVTVDVNGTTVGSQNLSLPADSTTDTAISWNIQTSGAREITATTTSSVTELNTTNTTRDRIVSVAEGESSDGGGGSGGGGGGGGSSGSSLPSPISSNPPEGISIVSRSKLEIEPRENRSIATPEGFLSDPVINEVIFDNSKLVGQLEVRRYNTTNNQIESPPGDMVFFGEILLAREHTEETAQYQFALENMADRGNSLSSNSPDDLTVWTYEDGEWETTETVVSEDEQGNPTLMIQTAGDGFVAVTDAGPEAEEVNTEPTGENTDEQQDSDNNTRTDNETDTNDGTGETEDDSPGFGISVSIVAIVLILVGSRLMK